MRTIFDRSVVLEYPPFNGVLSAWFSLAAEDRGGVGRFLEACDDLADYRMVAEIGAGDPFEVLYSSAGSALERLYGEGMSGRKLNELYNDWFRKRAYEGYRKIAETRHPVYERREIAAVPKKLGYYKMHLPFGGDRVTKAVTYIVPMNDIKERSEWEDIVRKTPWL